MAEAYSDQDIANLMKDKTDRVSRRFLATITADRKRIEELESRVAFWDRVNERQYDKWIQLSRFWQKAENKPNTLPDRMKLMEWLIQHIQEGVESFLDQTTTIEGLKKDAEIKDSLAEGVMTLAEVYEQLEDAKIEIKRLRGERKADLQLMEQCRDLIGCFIHDEDANVLAETTLSKSEILELDEMFGRFDGVVEAAR